MTWRLRHKYIQGSKCNFQQQLCRERHWQRIPALYFYKYQVKSRHTLHNAGHLEATISHAVSQIHARTWFRQTENDRGSEHCQLRTTDFRLQILVFSVPNISSNWHGIPPPHTKIVPPTFKHPRRPSPCQGNIPYPFLHTQRPNEYFRLQNIRNIFPVVKCGLSSAVRSALDIATAGPPTPQGGDVKNNQAQDTPCSLPTSTDYSNFISQLDWLITIGFDTSGSRCT